MPGRVIGGGHVVVVEANHHRSADPSPMRRRATIRRRRAAGAHRPISCRRHAFAMLLDGKKLLITGVLTDDSIAFAVAKVAQEAGRRDPPHQRRQGRAADRAGRAEAADRRPTCCRWTSTTPTTSRAVADEMTRRWGRLDGALHAIALRAAGRARRQLPDRAVGERGDRRSRPRPTRSRRSPSGCSSR